MAINFPTWLIYLRYQCIKDLPVPIRFLRDASIKTKLMVSMAACMLLFVVISAVLSVTLTAEGLRQRAVQ